MQHANELNAIGIHCTYQDSLKIPDYLRCFPLNDITKIEAEENINMTIAGAENLICRSFPLFHQTVFAAEQRLNF